MTTLHDLSATPAVAAQLAGFIDRYTVELAGQIAACRAHLHWRVPSGYELVYDNYNALVFAYAPTPKPGRAELSIAAYPRWITLFFLNGATLPDPEGLLEGAGKQVRGIRLRGPEDLDMPGIGRLIGLVLASQAQAFAAAPPLQTVVKSISSRQRCRRPA